MEQRYWTRTHVPSYYDDVIFDYQILNPESLFAPIARRLKARTATGVGLIQRMAHGFLGTILTAGCVLVDL